MVERWHKGPQKKQLDFGANPGHVTLGLGLRRGEYNAAQGPSVSPLH